MNKLMELRQELARLYADERADLERSQRENRGLTPAEEEQSQRRTARMEELEKECQAIDAVNLRAAQMKERVDKLTAAGLPVPGRERSSGDAAAMARHAVMEYTLGNIGAAERTMAKVHEMRGTQNATVFGEGGALILPTILSPEIMKLADDEFFVGGLVQTDLLTQTASITIPTFESESSDFDWTAELATGTEKNVTTGARQLTPYPMAGLLKVSNTLMRLVPNAEGEFIQRMGYIAGGTFEKSMLTGNGINKPLGMLANSGPGAIPTSRDQTGAVTWDKLYETIGSLKESYRRRAVWLTHRDHITTLRKTKDSQGRYLVDINTANNDGITTLLAGRPVFQSEFFPSGTSTGDYSFLLGDMSYYRRVIVSATMSVQILRELFATANTTGAIFRMEADGMPVFGAAFARLKFA